MIETEAPASVRRTCNFHKDFNGKPPAIAPSSLILVTGVNCFIGSHVADQLLQAGYRVRGTTRDTAKTDWVKEMLDKQHGEGKFEAVIVKSMADTRAFDEACKRYAFTQCEVH